MRIFLSYPSDEAIVAEEISLALTGNGHKVFFDRASLAEGEEYHNRIRREIDSSDAMVFLLTPKSIAAGGYTLSELEHAKVKWRNPSGYVLPVMLRETPLADIPPYLRSVTILSPRGNVAADVAAKVEMLLARSRRRRPRLAAVAVGVGLTALLAVAFALFQIERRTTHTIVLPNESDRAIVLSILDAVTKSGLEAKVREEIDRQLHMGGATPFAGEIERTKDARLETARGIDVEESRRDLPRVRDAASESEGNEEGDWVVFVPDMHQSRLANVTPLKPEYTGT